jgi:hypothetical protein
MSEWQPIETAPKDGTAILVSGLSHGKRYIDINVWRRNEWHCFHPEDNGYTVPVLPATHWQPLPEPPQ